MFRDEATILDMLRAAQLAVQFLDDSSLEKFTEDTQLQSSVLMQMLVLGEAVKRLSEEFRRQHPDIPWGRIARLRDRVIHHYDELDLEVIWETAHHNLPELVKFLRSIAPHEGK